MPSHIVRLLTSDLVLSFKDKSKGVDVTNEVRVVRSFKDGDQAVRIISFNFHCVIVSSDDPPAPAPVDVDRWVT